MEHLMGVLALLVLAGGALLVLAPFVTALLWGAILAYCSWQPFHRLALLFGGRRTLAALLVVVSLLVVLIGPICYAVVSFSTRAPELVGAVQARLATGVPPLPDWLAHAPLIGPSLEEVWNKIAAHNPEMVQRLRELAKPLLLGALGAGLTLLQGLGLLVLSVLFAGFFYLSGASLGIALEAAMWRIAGERAGYLLGLIGGTVKGVVYGILGTSLVQAVLCAAGYWLVGLPSPALLGLATFFLAIIPGGPLVIVVPGVLWLVQQGERGWAIFLVVWVMVVGVVVDNVLKPMIIGKSSHMPFILIMLGVIGGAAAFGLLGVFVGPTLLAVAHAVVRDWTMGSAARQDAAGAPLPDPGGDPAPRHARDLPL
jgi:predicted PurR-regulated permease PerM